MARLPIHLAVATLLLSVSYTPGSAETVQIRLETTDLSGTPISSVGLGSDFVLHTFVEDVRSIPLGVFSAYLDVFFDSVLVSVDGSISFGPVYPNGRSGDTATPGILDEVGAIDGIDSLGGGEFLLFSVQYSADAIGQAVFAGDPADEEVVHAVTVFGLDSPVPVEEIDYGTVSINVVPEPWSVALAALALLGIGVYGRWQRCAASEDNLRHGADRHIGTPPGECVRQGLGRLNKERTRSWHHASIHNDL